MPVKRPQFINGEIYHIITRGIAGQKTFLEESNYLRYLISLYKFNDEKTTLHLFSDSLYREAMPTNIVVEAPKLDKPRNPLVEILGFCLMPNHIHLLVRQIINNGVSLFIQKMGGYSTYFNKKYQRFGALFQRPFKAVHIKNNDQLMIVIAYIHLNPIDLIEPNWKIKGISDIQKVIEFLESYRWSSYPYYLGKQNFPWVVESSFLKNFSPDFVDFQNFVKARLFDKIRLKIFLEKSQNFSLEK